MRPHQKEFMPLISAFVDGELEADQQRQLERHLEACAECREVFEDFAGLSALSSSAKSFPVNPYFLTRLRARLTEETTASGDVSVIEAKLLVPFLAVLVVTLIILFSVVEKEKVIASDDYLYFGGRRTVVEQQMLSRAGPISKDEVLLLTVATQWREEANGR